MVVVFMIMVSDHFHCTRFSLELLFFMWKNIIQIKYIQRKA